MQSRAQDSCWSPHKSIPFYFGGPSEVFIELGQCPGVPRSSKPVSLENELRVRLPK